MAITIFCTFGDQAFALPEKFIGVAVDGFLDAAAEGIVFVGCGAATRQADADQAVLAVVAVLGDEFLSGATAFTNQVAVGVLVVMAVALHEQAIAFHVGEIGRGQFILAEQVACGVVSEALRHSAAYADQAIQWIVVIAAIVVDAGEVAVGIVVVATLEQVIVPLTDAVRLQAALFIVLVLAE